MPPEYIENSDISKKFDVFSLGGIIIKIMDGKKCHSRFSDMGVQKFIEHVRNRNVLAIYVFLDNVMNNLMVPIINFVGNSKLGKKAAGDSITKRRHTTSEKVS